ncbi:MAG: glycosyltransferase [Flavisolibacter sp.]
MKHIYFTVTNDLSYDQRMHRICNSLAGSGFRVTLVGRKRKASLPLQERAFVQKRLGCFFNRGFLFYAEYNLRLFIFLLSRKMDGVCAIDLDTILPCLWVSRVKGIPRIYDAHEYFTELKEVRTRPLVRKCWLAIEKWAVPRYAFGYTVSKGLAEAFEKKYKRQYLVIRNLPFLRAGCPGGERKDFLLYQGAVNEARGFEWLIPAMKQIPYPLIICGDGNFMPQLQQLIRENGVENKVELKGMLLPDALWEIAQKARLGLCLAEKEGLNQYLALPNKFFDYMHAGLPQIAMKFPEYEKINGGFEVACLIPELSPDILTRTVNQVMEDDVLLARLRDNCLKARKVYSWQEEEKSLRQFYQSIFHE